jgi:uncharacterized repeat protein (TIGR03803 family)
MKTLTRFALPIGAAVLFAGCALRQAQGDSQSLVGAPNVMPQARTGTSSPYQVLYSFLCGDDGCYPSAGVIYVNGTLYGTTSFGGERYCRCGTIYSMSPTGAENVLYSFSSMSDGETPGAPLTEVNGVLYGTTPRDGYRHCRCGTFYRISPTGKLKVLHAFKGGSDVSGPGGGGLINVNGTLYGTAAGPGCCGSVYSISTAGTVKVIYSFKGGTDGSGPVGSLVYVKDTFYGATQSGGIACRMGSLTCGTVYSVTRSGKESVLHRFTSGSDGQNPVAGLTDVNGTLYGTTIKGGGGGTIYAIGTTGSERVIYRFHNHSRGYNPQSGLLDVNGTLYGTTAQGPGGHGVLYSVSTAGKEKVLHSTGAIWNGVVGGADLIEVNGVIYGTTFQGGSCYNGFGCGTVFAYSL